jgi:iron-sulfur cluster assembly accessory protein
MTFQTRWFLTCYDDAKPPGLEPGRRGRTEMTNTISLTDAAARRIATIVARDAEKTALRVSVEGGGCSGFSYKFDLVNDRADDDIVIEKNNARVLIDSMSVVYMEGSEIDFVDNLMGQSFQIKNPNAVASCGCGTSFAI